MEDKNRSKSKRNPHPKEQGNIFKHFFFWWQVPLLIKGWRSEINEDNLFSVVKEHDSGILGDKLEKLWIEETSSKTPSLRRALAKQFGFEFFLHGFMYLPANIAMLVLKPLLLQTLLDYFSENEAGVTLNEAYVSAASITLLVFLHILFFNFMLLQMTTLGMKMRVACSSLIYRHVLGLKMTDMQQVSAGKVLNLLSNDVARFDEGFTFCHFLWIGPLQLAVSIAYADLTLGSSALVGVGILICFLLFQIYLSRKVSKCRSRVAQKTDTRIRLVNAIVCGIQIIKMQTWEEPFVKVVRRARKSEMEEIRRANYFRFTLSSGYMFLLPLALLVNVLIFLTKGWSLTPQYIYSLSSIYQDLLLSAVMLIPTATIFMAEVNVSLNRIQEFLLTGLENDPRIVRITQKIGIEVTNVTVAFGAHNVLENVTFRASPGELVGVIGCAGSGKSVLLQTILREIRNVKGTVTSEGDIAYASQDPWIFSTSVRQNILFGEDLDMGRYLKVVRVCALEKDISGFSHGDETLVGERGAMLSGGQKARISLARAVYKNADIYLLDDPLSAVDTYVARHIFDECILKYLKGKCVVLVTHQVQYLQKADRIYIVADGAVRECDNHKQLREELVEKKAPAVILSKESQLPEQVKEERGHKVTDGYRTYISAAGHWCFTFTIVFLFIFTQAARSAIEYFLSFWVNVENGLIDLGADLKTILTRKNFLVMYSVLFLCLVFGTYGSSFALVEYCTRSSKTLHEKLLSNTIKGTTTFFNQHSSGQILNRFSKDIGAIDEVLALFIYYFVPGALVIMGLLVVVSISNYWMVLPAIVLCSLVYLCAIVFQRTNKNIKRTEAITRSYVFSHLTATVHGLTTIRAFGAQKIVAEEFDKHQNLHTTAFYLQVAVYYAFGFWVSMACVVYTGILSFSFLFLSNDFHAASIGLAITLSSTLTEIFQYIVKDWCVIDTNMTSVERVQEYINLEPETDSGSIIPPEEWPSEGNITFDSVSLRYSPSKPAVLKQVTLHISAGQKIGIVGRTGAGKTSLISALFRLFDFQGAITIDGFDTDCLPLHHLRSKISIIPQDPVLFVGTLRQNLDPFDQFTDADIWNALNDLELRSIFSRLPQGLRTEVLEGGSNFSVGQRQLLCLVRTMLRRSRIIVLDEATASVDHETDQIIQSIIRRKFMDCTVLIVAHRLNTVIDSDKILVMENGRVEEFDHPYRLLQNKDGAFYGYVKESGGMVMENMMKIAADAYETRLRRK